MDCFLNKYCEMRTQTCAPCQSLCALWNSSLFMALHFVINIEFLSNVLGVWVYEQVVFLTIYQFLRAAWVNWEKNNFVWWITLFSKGSWTLKANN